MSTIFISYSTKDRATADIVYKQLIEMGYEKPFRDDHPDSGIPAGSDWEQELYRKLRLCKALIVLCSKNWLDSKWCFAELAYAKAMGKEFFPIRIDGSNDVPSVVAERQAIDLSDLNVWQRLRNGLEDAKLAPHDDFFWDISECPYPGLEPFTENHAGVYFGRDTEIQKLRELLNQMRSYGQPRLLYVVGASGSGKSSLVMAGLLPRLKTKETGQWYLFRTFRWNNLRASSRTWAEQLAVDMADAWPKEDTKKPEWSALQERYTLSDTNTAATSADRFIDDTKNLLVSLKRSNSTPLFILDQFEEVLVSTDGEPTGPFLEFLGSVMSSPRSPWRCVATVRSDFLNTIQTRAELIAWDQHTHVYSLPLMNPDRFYDVIRRPAEKVGITFEPETLVDQIVKDTGNNDALPLLAFTLRELYQQYGDDRRFTYDKYANKLGRLEGCLKQVADELLTTPLNSKETERALQLAFSSHLVEINEQDEFVRRTALWSAINPAAQPVLRTFIARRLVTSRLRNDENPQSEQVVEVAHEALFRKWDRLKDWLDARRDLLRWRRDVRRDRLADKEKWKGLTRSQLAIARDWPKQRSEELTKPEIHWINVAKQGVAVRWGTLAATALAVAVVAAVALYKWNEADALALSEGVAKELAVSEGEKKNKALEELQRSLRFSDEALRNARSNLAIAFSSHARNVRGTHPQRSLLLASEAVKTWYDHDGDPPVPESHEAILESLESCQGMPLQGHSDSVFGVWFSTNHQYVISQGRDNTVRLWDLSVQSPKATVLDDHESKNSRKLVRMSQSGKWLAIESAEYAVRLFDLHSNSVKLVEESVIPLRGHANHLESLQFSRDERLLVSSSADNTINVWELTARPRKIHTMAIERQVNDGILVDVSADGNWIAVGTTRGALQLWDLREKTPKHWRLRGDYENVYAVSFSEDSLWLATSHCSDNEPLPEIHSAATVRLWDLQSDDPPTSFQTVHGLNGRVHIANFSPNGLWLITASIQHDVVRLWRLKDANVEKNAVVLPMEDINNFVFSADGRWLATYGSFDKIVKLWDLTREDPSQTVVSCEHEEDVESAAFSSDNCWLMTAGADKKVRMWDLSDQEPRQRMKMSGHDGPILGLAISNDNRLIATGSTDASIRLWDVNAQLLLHPASRGSILGDRPKPEVGGPATYSFEWPSVRRGIPFQGQSQGGNFVEVSPDGRWLIDAAQSNNNIHLWNISANNATCSPVLMKGHEDGIKCYAVSGDSRLLVTGAKDKMVRVWNLEKSDPSQCDFVLPGHKASVGKVAISKDNRWIASGDSEGGVFLWDLAADEPWKSPISCSGHEGYVLDLAFSSDGRWLATGGWDGTARLWTLSDDRVGQLVSVLKDHKKSVWSLAFSPDSHWLATASTDRTSRLWDLTVSNPADKSQFLDGHGGIFPAIDFSPNGEYVCVAGHQGQLWPISTEGASQYPLVLEGHHTPGRSHVRFSPNGRWLVALGWDTLLYDLNAPHAHLRPIKLSKDCVQESITFTPDSRWLIIGFSDGRVRFWPLHLDDLLGEAQERLKRPFTDGEWKEYFPGLPRR